MAGEWNGADAAAVHHHLVAQPLGPGDSKQIEPQRAVAGHILHQGAAAVDVEVGLAHPPQKAGEGKGVDGVDPVGEAGVVRVAGEHPDGEVRVDLAQLGDNGLQDGVVAGVAPAVGAAYQGAVPAAFLRLWRRRMVS